MDLNQTNEPRFTDEEMAEVDRFQSDPTSEYYYNDPDESFMSRLKRKLAPYGEDFKGFIEYLFTPSRHFGTGQYSEGGLEVQMSTSGLDAEGRRRRTDSSEKYKQRVEEGQEDIAKAASFVVPFYDSGVNIANVAQEYMKPEQERDYEYIKDQFREAGQSAAIEGGLLLMGGVAGKYGAKGIKALADKIKQYEIDPTAISAFGAGAIRKKPTIDRAADVSEAERLIDDPDALKAWQETEGGKGKRQENPTDSEAAAEALYRGDITSKEARKRVGEAIPPPKEYTADEVRKMMPTVTDVTGAMGKKARDYGILGVKGFDLKEGQLLGTRLDIPAYNKYDKWVVSIHDGGTKEKINLKGSVLGYGQAIRLKNVRFGSQSKEALDIARGKILVKKTGKEKPFGKSTIARAVGEYVPEDPYKLQEMAASIIESGSKEWTQVGMNPYRGSQFYDKKTGKIIFDAEEMIQVGPLVLAKNAKVATISDLKEMAVRTKDGKLRMFNEGGMAMDDQMEMAFMQEGGVIDDDLDVDPVSGNEVPPGSLAEEVRDDIPAQLSEGEYVVPADVVRYYGVKFFEDLRDRAKMGLAEMEANGRIGGEPVPEGGPVNDQELSEQEMAAIREVMSMAEGGTVQNPYLQQQQMYSQPAPQAIGNTIGYSGGGQVQGYQPGGPVSTPVSSQPEAPSYARNPFDASKFGLGFSFMGGQQQQQQPVADNPNVPEVLTLYGPNGEIRTFNLPLSEADAAEVKRLKEELGYSETKAVTTTPVTGGGGGGSSTPPVETDPNKWMKEYDYTDMNKLASQTSDMLDTSPKGGVMGALMNAQKAAIAAGHIIIMKNNGATEEQLSEAQTKYNKFITDSKLGYLPQGLINGDRIAKDIVLNNPGKDIALDRNSVDVNNKPLFKDDNAFNKFMQKTAPKGMTFDPDAKYKTTDDSGKSVEVGGFKREGSAAPTKSLRPIGRPARPADKTPIAIPTGRESVPVGSLPAAAPKSAEDARAESRKASKKRRKYQKANRDRSRNKSSSKDRVKDYKSGGQKFRGQGGRAEGGLMKKGNK